MELDKIRASIAAENEDVIVIDKTVLGLKRYVVFVIACLSDCQLTLTAKHGQYNYNMSVSGIDQDHIAKTLDHMRLIDSYFCHLFEQTVINLRYFPLIGKRKDDRKKPL